MHKAVDYRPCVLHGPQAPCLSNFSAESSDSPGRHMEQGGGKGAQARGDPRSFLSTVIQQRLNAYYAL